MSRRKRERKRSTGKSKKKASERNRRLSHPAIPALAIVIVIPLCYIAFRGYRRPTGSQQSTAQVNKRSEAAARRGPQQPRAANLSDTPTLSQPAMDHASREAMQHYNVGVALQSNGKLEEAIAEYHKALAIVDDVAEVHNNLAAALASQRKLSEATTHFRRVTELDPKYAEGHFNLGNALYEQDQTEMAIEHYRRAIELQPDYAKAHNNLAVALKKIGKPNEAYKHLSEAMRLKRAAEPPE